MLSDGSIHPGIDPVTGEPIDLVTAFQYAADPDPEVRARLALHACPGQGSCGGMFTYNTMQTFIGVLGMEPLHMVAPASDDTAPHEDVPRRARRAARRRSPRPGIRPRDIVTPASMRNAFVVVMAMGGSTNVVLHGPEIARAAGFDLWDDVISQQEFNELSHRLPVLVNMRPFGAYSMVDVDAIGGVAVIVQELLAAGELDGSALTCTGETLAEQVERLDPPAPDGEVVLPVSAPFKPTGGLRLLRGNLAPDGGAILKVAGVEGGIVDGRFTGRARVFEGEPSLIAALEDSPDSFADGDIVIVRYEGPRGAPGMPEMLDPTSRITALCRARGHHRRAHDRRSVLGRIGRARHRARVARGLPRRPDRAAPRRRHDHRRPQRRPARLSSSSTTAETARAARAGVERRGRRERRRAPRRPGGHHPGAQADPRHRHVGPPRRGRHERLTRRRVPEILEVETARALLDARALDREIAKVHAPDCVVPQAWPHAARGARRADAASRSRTRAGAAS